MHYTVKMNAERIALEEKIREMREMVIDFRTHLVTPKFQGDGNDYIQTSDVEARLMQMQMALL